MKSTLTTDSRTLRHLAAKYQFNRTEYSTTEAVVRSQT